MRRIVYLVAPISMLLSASASGAALATEPDLHRRFEVRDSIEFADFTEAGSLSPDGKWLVAVTQRGVLPQGVTEATVWLFDADAVNQSIRTARTSVPFLPVALVRLSAAINGDGGEGFGKIISRLTWESDSKSLLFLGRDG